MSAEIYSSSLRKAANIMAKEKKMMAEIIYDDNKDEYCEDVVFFIAPSRCRSLITTWEGELLMIRVEAVVAGAAALVVTLDGVDPMRSSISVIADGRADAAVVSNTSWPQAPEIS